MKITTITVTAGRTFNHPFEQYSNLRPEVTLTATLDEGEDAQSAAKVLQSRAEGLVEDHKQGLIKSIHDLQNLTERQAEMRGLQKQLEIAEAQLTALRSQYPELQLEN